MRLLLCALLAIFLLAPACAQPGLWSRVDWRSITALRVKSLLADDHNRGWQAVEPTSTDDPAHRIPPDKASALVFAACYSRDAGVIDALIAAGARADDSGGLSPLMYAAQYNPDPAILDALIAAGAGVRKDLGYSMLARPALTYAAQYNADPAVVADLIAKGAAVNAKVSVLDNMGFTPLMYAAQYNENPAVIRELVKDGAVVDMADHAKGQSAGDVHFDASLTAAARAGKSSSSSVNTSSRSAPSAIRPTTAGRPRRRRRASSSGATPGRATATARLGKAMAGSAPPPE